MRAGEPSGEIMAEDDLDLSEFEEYSETAASASGTRGGGGGGGGRGAGHRRRRRWPWLVAGVVLGVVGTVFMPGLVGPYLPTGLRPSLQEVRGAVLGKRSEGDRLLLTVDTERGALLATFRQRVPEIDLLVEEGDSVVLGLSEYAPLVEDPVLEAVSKGRGPGGGGPEATPAEEERPGSGEPDGPTAGPAAPDTVSPGPTPPDTAGG